MGVSKPRKHGRYLGGRPWPQVCPTCRKCGLGPPEMFYNARGLCNICHKFEREVGGRDALEAWEPLPPEADDRSHERLVKNPVRWLQRYMGGPYTQEFLDVGIATATAEAHRVFQAIVDRWFGRPAPVIKYLAPPTYAQVAWGMSSARADAHEPVPLSGLSTAHRAKVLAEVPVGTPWDEELVSYVARTHPSLPKPKVFRDECTVLWVVPVIDICVTVTGPPLEGAQIVSLVQDDKFIDYVFEYAQMDHLLRCLAA